VKDGRAADRDTARNVLAAMDTATVAAYLRGKSTFEMFDIYLGEGAGFLGPDNPKLFQDGEVIRAGDPIALLADPSGHHIVPTMLGSNREEPKLFMLGDPSQVTRVFGIPLRTKDPAAYDREAKFGAMSWKRGGVDEPARALSTAQPDRVFVYRWDWDEEGKRLGFIDFSHLLGAAHGLEIPFVFGHWELGESTRLMFNDANEQDRVALSNAMMAYWGRMAYDGDPGTGGGKYPPWQPWSNAGGARTFVLDTESGGGLRMTDIEVTPESLLAGMEAEPLDPDGKCRLFARVFRFADPDEKAWVDAAWTKFAGGACAGMDQVALVAGE
jgi:para-nitrobenzyl esterase